MKICLRLMVIAACFFSLWGYNSDEDWSPEEGVLTSKTPPSAFNARRRIAEYQYQCPRCHKIRSHMDISIHMHNDCFDEKKPCPHCPSSNERFSRFIDILNHNNQKHSTLKKWICYACHARVLKENFSHHFGELTLVKNAKEMFADCNDGTIKISRHKKPLEEIWKKEVEKCHANRGIIRRKKQKKEEQKELAIMENQAVQVLENWKKRKMDSEDNV